MDAPLTGAQIAGMDLKDFALHHLAPGLGAVIATLMFLTPLQAIRQANKSAQLGDLNPLPLIAICANCLAWLVYGSIAQDIYVIAANEPGLLLGLYMTISAFGLAETKIRRLMMNTILFFTVLISTVSISIALFVKGDSNQLQAAGYQAVGVLLIYYAAPLSALATVLRSRSSATIYWPLSVMSCVNGTLWVLYGALAVNDPFIWAPNAVGAFFGVLQLLLCCVFPRRSSTSHRRGVEPAVGEDSVYEPLQSAA